ncbi:MAG: thiamine-phosphate kinase, partial [Verrucomicrobiales bacterium]
MKKKNLQLRDIGEDALVAALTARLAVGEGVVAAAGDDCAILEGTERGRFDLFKTDCIVEGVHFESAAPPSAVGWKAMARTVSDFGAMGGLPRYALVTVALRGDSELTWARALYRGLEKAAARFGVSIVGGETTRIPEGSPALISVALTGEVARARCARRSGGKPGDVLLVTGRLG